MSKSDEEDIRKSMEDFNEYLRQGDPGRRERTYLWKTAIGLQAVDGLRPSEFLIKKAQQNIEGELSIEDVQQQVHNYYKTKDERELNDDNHEEADKVAANITRLLKSQTVTFSTFGFLQIHRNIFDGVFKHAGSLRDYNITKSEWVLRGDTVRYMTFEDLRDAIDYDIEQEKLFSYRGLSTDDVIAHICKFVADLWQIHPFCEGNTRTTAVFTIQYLRSLGFRVNNDIFADHSWYFRNALVRYVYKNKDGVQPEPKYLIRFFRNLLLGECNDLHNRYLLINPPESWKEAERRMEKTEQVADSNRTSTEQVPNKFDAETEQVVEDSHKVYSLKQRNLQKKTEQAAEKDRTSSEQVPNKFDAKTEQADSDNRTSSEHSDMFSTGNEKIVQIVRAIGDGEWKVSELMEIMGLKHRPNFLNLYLNPAVAEGYVSMLFPDSPRHPRQKYLLTVKGMFLLEAEKANRQILLKRDLPG